ncbi:MAG: hypothetical protein LBH00_10535 [Planctomycetaceae bacterium]|jgi:hypothetical protein|nr:hypothetical protein [Planctomycetaceae bacterium]
MQAYKTAAGAWQLNFSENGRQKVIYLGRGFTAGSADRIAKTVTDIIAYRKRCDSLPVDLRQKIETFPLRVRDNMRRAGLLADSGAVTLSELLLRYYDSIKHLKPKTLSCSRYAGKQLTGFFGEHCLLSAVKHADALAFRAALLKTLAECTVTRNLRRCNTMFRFAVDSGWLARNPFDKMPGGSEVNVERRVYVDRETVRRVMDACKTDEDRLLLALARFGGLRIPSEIQHLRFRDFAGNVIRIHKDTKTGAREVPLFGEIREIFERLSGKPDDLIFHCRVSCLRLRIVLAIRQAGVPVWTKLFVNLRSSCITDLDERRYSDVTMNAIFGNSAAVRNRHYVQFRREREYAKVLSDDERLLKLFRSGECTDISDDILLQKIHLVLENTLK